MKKILITILLILGILIVPNSVLATTFDLIAPSAPSGGFVRGQEVKFTINIDTEAKSLSSTSIGMTYETQYLEYISTVAGNTFTTVSANVLGSGKLILTGSSTTPYSGSGVFAYVTYKLIAASPGSTELCVLYNPAETPTAVPQPTSPPGQPTYTPYLTSPPGQPTSLPESGESRSVVQGIILASLFFTAAGASFFVLKKT